MSKKKPVIITVIATFLVILLIEKRMPGQSSMPAVSDVYFIPENPKEEINADLGEVYDGGTGQGHLSLHNNTTASVVLVAEASCGCLNLTPASKSLEPGQTTKVSMRYDSYGNDGAGSRSIAFLLRGDMHTGPPVLRTGKATVFVKPSFQVGQKSIEFRLRRDEPLKPITIEITNVSSNSIHFVPAFVGDNETAFDVQPADFILDGGAKREIAVLRKDGLGTVPLISKLVLNADLISDGNRHIQLSKGIPVFCMAMDVVVAVPGSLIFGKEAVSGNAEKHLRIQSDSTELLEIKKKYSSSDKLGIAEEAPRLFTIKLQKMDPGSNLDESISIEYELGKVPGKLVIPVLGAF